MATMMMMMMMMSGMASIFIIFASPASSHQPIDDLKQFLIDSSSDHDSSSQNSTSSPPSSYMKSKSKAMFVIGDSSVDCGENTLLYPLLRQNLSLLPCTNGSDSTLVHHFLAEKMGLPEIPTFYDQNGTIEGILNGLNFGSAQSTILSSKTSPSFQALNEQLRQTFDTMQLIQLQLGQDKANHFIKSSIFYLSLGKDDYINYFFPDNSSSSSSSSVDFPEGKAFTRVLVDEMSHALRDMYEQGARKVVLMGVLPLGCAPRMVVNWYFSQGRKSSERRCVGEINDLIVDHNRQLSERIIELNLEYSDANFVFCDVYQGMMQMISKPHRFGFEDVRGACCGEGWHGAAIGCQSMEMACNQTTSAHLWWDFYNPTLTANSLLADSAWSGQPLADICRPLSIRGLANASS